MPYTVEELEHMQDLVAEHYDGRYVALLSKLREHIMRQRSAEAYNAKPRRTQNAF